MRPPKPAVPARVAPAPAPEAGMALALASAGPRASVPGGGVLRRKCAQCAAAEALQARTGIAQRLCPSCEREREAMAVQRRASAGPASETSAPEPAAGAGPLAAVRTVVGSGGGVPLDPGTRAFYEAGFGRDLGGVRVHTGAAADASARGVNALAYTLGRDVVFRAGSYAPRTPEGERLLAHELAHTLQQPDAPVRAADGPLEVGAADDPLEREADAAAARVLRRQPAPGGAREPDLTGARPGIIQRTGGYGYGGYGGYPSVPGGEQGDHPSLPSSGYTGLPSLPGGGGGGGHPCSSSPSPHPPLFCTAFPTKADAIADRDSTLFPGAPSKGLQVLVGASTAAGGSGLATALYSKFMYGGSPTVENASAGAGEFTASNTTAHVTRKMIVDVLAALMHDRDTVFAEFQRDPSTRIDQPVSAAQAQGVDNQQSPYALIFCDLDLPGVLAGGVGKTQTTAPVGADTSAAANDFRNAWGSFGVTGRIVSPDEVVLTVSPQVEFHVTDTIDFCPGNPGGWFAQFLTLPMSRWEASGISGDVTFQLNFPAPAITGHLTLRRVNGVVIPAGLSFGP